MMIERSGVAAVHRPEPATARETTTAVAAVSRLRTGFFLALMAPIGVLLAHLSQIEPTQLQGQTVDIVSAPVAQQPWRTAAYTRVYFASPSGRAGDVGSVAQPLDLRSALSAAGPLRPGDLLWLRGGTYFGHYRSELVGTASAFIVVAQFPGERAILDGAAAPDRAVLRVEGAYAVYWGFEVTNSAPARVGQVRGTGVDVFGPYTKFINLVIHDTGNGLGVWTPALEAEVYGNLIYRVGWDDKDRGHGHSIYIQNNTLTKRVVDNILFDGHSFGVHAYTQGGEINNLYFEGNIAFDHGLTSTVSGAKANFLVGGRRVARHTALLSNYAYYPWSSVGRNVDLGYIDGCTDALVRGNYLAGGVTVVVTRCSDIAVTGNGLNGQVDGVTALRFPDNEYIGERPKASRVFVRPNRYVRGRGHVAVFNWGRQPSLRIDVSSLGLRAGEPFEIRDVRNYFGEPLLTATYGEPSIELPLSRMIPVDTNAGAPGLPPEFGAVVVLPRGPVRSDALPWAFGNDAVH